MASMSLSTVAQFANSVTTSVTASITQATAPPNISTTETDSPETSTAFSIKSSTSTATSAALPTFKRHISTSYTRQTYYEMARAMKEEIEIKDRRYHLKVYKQCFLGSDAVSFIKQYLDLESREEALQVGKELNDKIHCFAHVCGDHELKDEKLFYEFNDLSKSQEGCLATVIKSRRTTCAPQPTQPTISEDDNNSHMNRSAATNSLLDSDSEFSDDDNDDERENSAPDLNLLMKGMDAALSEEKEQQEQEQEQEQDLDESINLEREGEERISLSRPGRRPRSRGGSQGRRTRGDKDNSRREASPMRKERRGGGGDQNKESPEVSPTRSHRKERRERSPQRGGDNNKDGGGSRSPKPSQARVSRRARQTGGGRSRSKSPQKTGVQVERSSTFHGRGAKEARKGLMGHQQPGPGNKRLNALKKKKDSLSPVRKAVSDMSNYPESKGNDDGDEQQQHTATPKQRSASLKLNSSGSNLYAYPSPLGDLPPRASSAPGSRIAAARRGRSPTKGKTPTTQHAARVLDEAGKDFLQRGHASWGPDSDEFLLPFDDDEQQYNEGHSSMNDLFSEKDREEVEARMAQQKKAMEDNDDAADEDDSNPKSRSSIEVKSRSSLEIKSKPNGKKKSPRSRATSADAKSASSSQQKGKAEKHSSLNKVLDSRKMIMKATLGRKKSDSDGKSPSRSSVEPKSRDSSEARSSRPDGKRSRPSSVEVKSRPSSEIKATTNPDASGKSLNRSKTSLDAKSRSSLESKQKQGLRRSQTTDEAKPRSSLENKKTAAGLSPKRSPRSRASVSGKVRASLVIKARASMDKDAKSGLDKGSNHKSGLDKGSNHKSGLDKGSNHSLGSAGSARSALLAALYSENLDGSDQENRVSIGSIAAANDSVTSALNSSLLGELSDDEEFAEQ